MNVSEFVTWHHADESTPGGPLLFWDAVWSLFRNSGDFYRLLEHTIPRLTAQGLSADAALAEAMQVIFRELLPLRDVVLRQGLVELAGKGVPSDELTPTLVGQDWGHSQLTSEGRLSLRVEMWHRAASARIWCEAAAKVAFPRAGSAPVVSVERVAVR